MALALDGMRIRVLFNRILGSGLEVKWSNADGPYAIGVPSSLRDQSINGSGAHN